MEVSNFMSRPLYSRKGTPESLEYEAGWAPETSRTFWKTEKFLAPTGIRDSDRLACNLFPIPTTVPRLPMQPTYNIQKRIIKQNLTKGVS